MKYVASALLVFALVFTASAQDVTKMKVSSSTNYRLMSDPPAIRTLSWSNVPSTMHIKGVVTNKGFLPLGKIEGSGKLCADGKDWLDLTTGTIHVASENATPASPYVMGCKSKLGGFSPATREIQ